MDSSGAVDHGSFTPQHLHQVLHQGDVLILADGTDQFHLIIPFLCTTGSHWHPLPIYHLLCKNAGVEDTFPDPILLVFHMVRIVSATIIIGFRPQVFSNGMTCGIPSQSCHFNLNPKGLVTKIHSYHLLLLSKISLASAKSATARR